MSLLNDDLEDKFDDEELSKWLALDHINGTGTSFALKLWEIFGSLSEAWKASSGDIKGIKGVNAKVAEKFIVGRKAVEPMQLLETLRSKDVTAYPFYHPNYPLCLRHISDPPLLLYLRGNLKTEDMYYAVSIVGTRKPSAYGKTYAREFALELASRGVTIVSGMAIGIDSVAHWGALEAKGRTLAVLACGPDICYPQSNKPLYDKLIVESGGAVISEFFPGVTPEPWQFPARNRIISGLSHAVLVIEGEITSGSLITGKLGFEQDRNVFALPGRVDVKTSEGPNALIAQGMARLVRNYEDIMNELNWKSSRSSGAPIPAVVQLFGREREVYDLLSPEPMHFDILCHKTEMGAGEMSATLTMLELAGIISRHPGDWYSRDGQSYIV